VEVVDKVFHAAGSMWRHHPAAISFELSSFHPATADHFVWGELGFQHNVIMMIETLTSAVSAEVLERTVWFWSGDCRIKFLRKVTVFPSVDVGTFRFEAAPTTTHARSFLSKLGHRPCNAPKRSVSASPTCFEPTSVLAEFLQICITRRNTRLPVLRECMYRARAHGNPRIKGDMLTRLQLCGR
jgi:hypothetical protein